MTSSTVNPACRAAANVSIRLLISADRSPMICAPRSRPLLVAGDADRQRHRTRVVPLVVIRDRHPGQRGHVQRCGFVVAEAGAGGDEVEHLYHLRPHRTGEVPRPPEHVLPGDAALLVRRCPERQPRRTEEPVMRHDAVTRRPHMRHPVPHLLVNDDRASLPELRTRCGREVRHRSHADADNHERERPFRIPSGCRRHHPPLPASGRVMPVTVAPVSTVAPCRRTSAVTRDPSSGSRVESTSGPR